MQLFDSLFNIFQIHGACWARSEHVDCKFKPKPNLKKVMKHQWTPENQIQRVIFNSFVLI